MDQLIHRIIIPVDFSRASERAARFGCSLARTLGARAHLFHVIEPSEPDVTDSFHESGSSQIDRLLAEEAMRVFADRVFQGGAVSTEIQSGNVNDAIARATIGFGADLVVMATHGRSGPPHQALGSVAEQVIRTATCPVLVMRDSGQVAMHRPASVSSSLQTTHTA